MSTARALTSAVYTLTFADLLSEPIEVEGFLVDATIRVDLRKTGENGPIEVNHYDVKSAFIVNHDNGRRIEITKQLGSECDWLDKALQLKCMNLAVAKGELTWKWEKVED